VVKVYLKKWSFKILFVFLILLCVNFSVFAQENFENLKIPTDIKDLVANFSMIDYDIISFENSEKTSDIYLKYNYLGKEEINGIQTDKIYIEIVDKEQESSPAKFYFWFDENNIKQLQIDEEIIPESMAEMVADNILIGVFSPLKQLVQYNMQEFKKTGKVTKYKESHAGRELNITKIEVNNIPEYELKYGMTKIAQLENTAVVLEFEYISSVEDQKVQFKVNDFKLR